MSLWLHYKLLLYTTLFRVLSLSYQLWLHYKLLLYTTCTFTSCAYFRLWLHYKLLLYTTVHFCSILQRSCDYIINYYYIQHKRVKCLIVWRCDYIINYYYIQPLNSNLLNFNGLKHILLRNFSVFAFQNKFWYRFL